MTFHLQNGIIYTVSDIQKDVLYYKKRGAYCEFARKVCRDEGISGERFADTISRLGFEYVQDKLINNKIDKTAVLNKTVKGGATC